jgi:hypothetical protein
MGGTCSRYGRQERCIQGLVRIPEEKRPLERPSNKWEDNVEIYFQELGRGHGVDLSGSGEEKIRAFVNVVINFRVA